MISWPIKKDNLMRALNESRSQDKCTNELAEMLQLIAEKYSFHASFRNYSWREDFVQAAVLNLLSAWRKFDVKQPNPQPFGYFSRCCHNSFVRYIVTENQQRTIKDDLLISMGQTPSWHGQETRNTE